MNTEEYSNTKHFWQNENLLNTALTKGFEKTIVMFHVYLTTAWEGREVTPRQSAVNRLYTFHPPTERGEHQLTQTKEYIHRNFFKG